jgi:hypothetical protein
MRIKILRGEKDEKMKSYNEWLVVYRDIERNETDFKIKLNLTYGFQNNIQLI